MKLNCDAVLRKPKNAKKTIFDLIPIRTLKTNLQDQNLLQTTEDYTSFGNFFLLKLPPDRSAAILFDLVDMISKFLTRLIL